MALDEAVTVLSKLYKVRTGIEFYSALAAGRIDIADLKDPLTRHAAGEDITPTPLPERRQKAEETGSGQLIIGDSVRGLDYKLARCCNPLHGDEVFGFVTVSAGITIHRTSCPNANRLREQYPYRVISAKWRD